jgi:perosamine synthetase
MLVNWKIPLFKIYWDKSDIDAVTDTIKRGMNWAVGPNIEKFEKMITEYVGVKYCVTFNSGTSALHAVLLAHDIKQGDEVIVPSFSFIATANVALYVGAKPIFAEVENETYGLDPEDVKEKINKRTKAIIPIHYGGSPCMIEELKEIAEDNNLILIEDAAESLGAKVKNKKVGTFGDSAMFSFCQNKIITTGEGGAIVTDSKEIYEKLKLIRSHGRDEVNDYFSSVDILDYITLGFNFRMPDILAALGISQLKKIDMLIKMRKKNANYLNKSLSKIKEINLPIEKHDFSHVYQMYTIRMNSGKEMRNALIKHLEKNGIMSKIFFSPIHLTHFYMKNFGYKKGELPLTEKLSDQVLTLPMYANMTDEEKDYIIEKIFNFFKEMN